jgi:hypothetical protein
VYEVSVLSGVKTQLPLPEKNSIGMPFKRSMFSGVTRLVLVGALVVTQPRRPVDMSHS